MKKFIKKIFFAFFFIFLFNIVNPLIGLIRLKKDYKLPKIGAVKFFKENETQKDILVIGCSNLQHNIDFKKVQVSSNKNIDFLYFSGDQNSTFLKYLSDKGFIIGYKTIIFYLPYHLLQQKTFLNDKPISHYNNYASYLYSLNLIKNRPILFFYNWNKYYKKVKINREIELNRDYVANVDPYLDSMTTGITSFRNCNEFFKHSNHVVLFPNFDKKDETFLKKIVSIRQKVFIFFSPLPNIDENKLLLGSVKNNLKKSFKDILWINEPNLIDSSLFFDQWYHLNFCGRELETENMINGLKKMVNKSL